MCGVLGLPGRNRWHVNYSIMSMVYNGRLVAGSARGSEIGFVRLWLLRLDR